MHMKAASTGLLQFAVQPADIGLATENGKKLSCSWARQQAWLLLSFYPFPVGHPMSADCTHGQTDQMPNLFAFTPFCQYVHPCAQLFSPLIVSTNTNLGKTA